MQKSDYQEMPVLWITPNFDNRGASLARVFLNSKVA